MNPVPPRARRRRVPRRRGRTEQGRGPRRAAPRRSRSATSRPSLGMSEATTSRLFAGKYLLSRERAKEWELALLLVRLFRSLDALWGHEETARTWLASENLALGAAPARSPAHRRRPRPCRRVPGRRARSRLAPRAPLRLWRAVEAQHVVADDGARRLARRAARAGAPPRREQAAGSGRAPPDLHYLLFTPFRYPPPPGGSRFRGPNDPGVFYGADDVRTACAELGYWRWRHLLDTPALAAMPARAQTVFRTSVATDTVDLREPPFVRDRAVVDRSADYAGCQRFAVAAREAGVGAIRYESVRDPRTAAAARCSRPRVRPACARRAADVDAVGDARPRRVAAHGHRAVRSVRVPAPVRARVHDRRRLGRTDYAATWHAMQRFTAGAMRTRPTRSGSPSMRPSTRWGSPAGASICCATTAFPS